MSTPDENPNSIENQTGKPKFRRSVCNVLAGSVPIVFSLFFLAIDVAGFFDPIDPPFFPIFLAPFAILFTWVAFKQYGWIKRGTDKELKSNGGRKRVNVNGAVDVDAFETVTDFSKTINGASSLRLFRKIEAKHPQAKAIHVFVDNASYYVSKWLKGKLEDSKIKLH